MQSAIAQGDAFARIADALERIAAALEAKAEAAESPDDLLTAEEARAVLRCNRQKAREILSTVVAVELGGRIRYPRGEVKKAARAADPEGGGVGSIREFKPRRR